MCEMQKRLRQYTSKEHYFPDISDEDERLNCLHTGKLFRLKPIIIQN